MPSSPKIADPIIREFASAKRTSWSAANVYNAVGCLQHLQRHLAGNGLDLLEATPADLNEYLAERLERGRDDGGPLSPNTVIAHHRQLKAFYTWAASGDDPLRADNPMRRVTAPKAEDPPPSAMPVVDEHDYAALLATCRPAAKPSGKGAKTTNDRRDAAILALLWSTGMRRGELVAIDYDDVDWDRQTIHLRRTKGRGRTRSRDVVFDDEAQQRLNRYMLGRGNGEGPLFTSTHIDARTGLRKRMLPDTVSSMLERRCKQASVDPAKVVAHGFRRRVANDWQSAGEAVTDLETLMGWKHDGRMAAHYARKTETDRAIAAARRFAEARRAPRLRAV